MEPNILDSANGPQIRKALILLAKLYMEEHISEQVRVEDLSAIVYMEPTYFIRKFKKEFGQPPLTYFIGMKMNRAMQYLSTTDLSIEEISRLIGINDVAYFSRLFKKSCNISPSEYRKTFKKSSNG